MLEVRNPHSVLATFDVRPNAVRSVRVSRNQTNTPWDDVAAVARKNDVKVIVGKNDRPQKGRRETERAGAGSANVEPPSPVPFKNILRDSERFERGVWLALDQVQDPHNLGAIFRLAGFFGVQGIILTKDNSAPVNATVCDISTGGVEYVPFTIVPNLAQALKKAQKSDMWVLGTCERAKESLHQIDRLRKWILVMGNEGEGIRRLTRDCCDSLAAMPSLGKIPSLNVASATASCLTALTADIQ